MMRVGMAKAILEIPEMAIYTTAYVFSDQKDYISIGIAPGRYQLLSWINAYLQDFSVYYTISDLVNKYPEYYKGIPL